LEPNLFKKLLHRREAGIFFALVGLVILITGFQPNFIGKDNLFIVSRQIALTAIIALGVLFVILTGGIDLSVGSTVGLSGFICGLAMASGLHPLLAVLAGLLTGAAVGAVNGVIVAYVGVTPFIVTLGMLGAAHGAVLVIKQGDSVREISKAFIAVGNGSVFGISVPVLILIAIAIACYLVLGRTIFGRHVFAIGGNEKAAALSGINTRAVKFFTYVLCSSLSAVTGILYVARFQSAQADSGKGMELDAIAAAVIGGTSLMGGEGSVAGVLLGATIMGVIRNGLVLMRVSPYWQELIIGTIIVLAAILDVIRSRKRP
jgi:ribose/xylose/arabinose/galactoside ABC-type transport system permease subunit